MNALHSLALAALATFAFASCSALPPQSSSTMDPAPVLLVSIDGFRADFLDRGITPNLSRVAREGVHAQWMNPSYPSLTFPNHYTLVTGLRPDHHGIVHNTMRDAELGDFSLQLRDAISDGRWWGGEPIWVGVERTGLRTATLFWPGSEAAIRGVRPTRWTPYNGNMSMPQRVETVLGWLSEPAATRPRLATLYFDALDHTGHDFGPESAQTSATVREVDAAVGQLLDGLSRRGLADRVNVVIVSDHGMAPVPTGQVLPVEKLVDPALATRVTYGQVLGFVPQPGKEQAAEAQLLGRHEHHECWRKNELPAHWHYGTHPRIPPIVCQMQVGWDATTRQALARRQPGQTRGSHGFDPAAAEMRALFLARGPAFRKGVQLAPFDNVDVYPLLARLVGIQPAANDGSIEPLLPALKE